MWRPTNHGSRARRKASARVGFLMARRCTKETTVMENGMERLQDGGPMGRKCLYVPIRTV